MKPVPYIPENAPFNAEQRAWLNGFLAGLFSHADAPGASQRGINPASEKKMPLLIFYGSQTGTAEQLAKRIAAEAGQHGFEARVRDMNAFAGVDLKQESRLAIVTSTWGDGDPPDNAIAFWNFLNSESAPPLPHLNYSVLALGDKNYSEFCGAGKKFDERLAQLGATRIHPRAECDVDYEATAKAWITAFWVALESANAGNAGAPTGDGASNPAAPTPILPNPAIETTRPQFDRNNPFPARLLVNRKLTAENSAKDTRHFEIALHGSDLNYEVGDALGVMPTNCPALVGEILEALGFDGEEGVKNSQEQEVSLRHALLGSHQITQISRDFFQLFAERSGDARLKKLLSPERKDDLEKFLYGREIIDLLVGFPGVQFSPGEFISSLRKLQPRLYSISSSPKAHPGEVHLTVAAVRYESHARARKGVCSTFLADRVEPDSPVPVFIQTSHGFRLPQDGGKPIIMIGPGTGVAPFRAFLEERRALGAKGRNWLFFGDQRAETDFLYRDELETMSKDGTLARLDLAFSRDQPEKIYVQQRIRENSSEIWSWLESGAHVYVCGDAKRMAKDVDSALRAVIETAGNRTADQSTAYLQNLKTEKRYQRDVY